MKLSARYFDAVARIDAANALDPNRTVVNGEPIADEVLYAQRMSGWLDRLYPDASEALKLAARAQHIRRWEIPRESFPKDRAGYHRWRTTLYAFHAEAAGAILLAVGYDEAIIARVGSLLRKEKLKIDPEVQALEDVICMVFLENYFDAFAGEHDDDKLIRILQRTWGKMSSVGREAAKQLPVSDRAKNLLQRALTASSPPPASA